MQITTETIENALGQTLFRVTMRDEKGEVLSKILTLENYLTLLETSMRFEEKEDAVRVERRMLPAGYIDGAFTKSGYTVIWREKAMKRLLIHSSGHYQIPYPDLIFVLETKDGEIRQKYCFAAAGERLYRYPFGNVSKSGAVCMGNIKVDPKDSISSFAEEFFLGVTNEDYFERGESVKPKWSQTKLLENLSGKDVFPEKWLTKGRFETLEELINHVF